MLKKTTFTCDYCYRPFDDPSDCYNHEALCAKDECSHDKEGELFQNVERGFKWAFSFHIEGAKHKDYIDSLTENAVDHLMLQLSAFRKGVWCSLTKILSMGEKGRLIKLLDELETGLLNSLKKDEILKNSDEVLNNDVKS